MRPEVSTEKKNPTCAFTSRKERRQSFHQRENIKATALIGSMEESAKLTGSKEEKAMGEISISSKEDEKVLMDGSGLQNGPQTYGLVKLLGPSSDGLESRGL